jgi:hypothetical protein
MRCSLGPILFVASIVPCVAAPLAIVRPIISDSDGGVALPGGFEHVPGETIFFFCRLAGYQKTTEEKIHFTYTIEAVDPKGVPLMEPFVQNIADEVTPQDKEWMPKIQTEIQVPPLAPSGTYQIRVKAEDLVAKTKTEFSVPFQVHGRDVAPSDTLIVRNMHFFRSEDDAQPLEKAAYRPGDAVWARFDITGFRYGPRNKIDVSYVTSVVSNAGKVLWTQPEPAVEQSDSFYPKHYVPAAMGITLQKNFRPGIYTIAIKATDAVGNQSYESSGTFTVEE